VYGEEWKQGLTEYFDKESHILPTKALDTARARDIDVGEESMGLVMKLVLIPTTFSAGRATNIAVLAT
jgi:hypothetical protein